MVLKSDLGGESEKLQYGEMGTLHESAAHHTDLSAVITHQQAAGCLAPLSFPTSSSDQDIIGFTFAIRA